MLLLKSRASNKDKASLKGVKLSLGIASFAFILWLSAPASVLVAATLELPGSDGKPLEEVVRPTDKPGLRALLLPQQELPPLDGSKASFQILAAELINAGQKFFAIYFEKEKGKGGYYDLEGRSMARAFLRFPLEFISISSQFSHSRFHPILKVDRPHNGVDFAAKRGTPVRAVAEGKILYAGWRKGGYGRMIEIQHDSVYASRYAHLQGVALGMRRGVSVQKGQIIGYVGSSGRSTGAHLHFELYRDQEYVDFLKFEYPPEDKIEPALRRVFENAKQLFLTELASAPLS